MLVMVSSHSYIAALAPEPRDRLLAAVRELLRSEFVDDPMHVRYETWLWIATRR
jgi:hypothetical protein